MSKLHPTTLPSQIYLQRLKGLALTGSVKVRDGSIEVSGKGKQATEVLEEVLEERIDGLDLRIAPSRGRAYVPAPPRRYLSTRLGKTRSTLTSLSGEGAVKTEFKLPSEGDENRPKTVDDLAQITIFVEDREQMAIADALIADQVYGAPVVFKLWE